jgi:hypothetical protein
MPFQGHIDSEAGCIEAIRAAAAAIMDPAPDPVAAPDDPALAAAPGPEPEDDDLELALALHRQLNAPQRRPRHQKGAEAVRDAQRRAADRAALAARPDSSGSSSDEGPAAEEGGAHQGSAKRRRHSSPEGSDAPGRPPPRGRAGPGKSRLGRPPARRPPRLPHESAATAAVQKAGRAGGRSKAPLTHFKLFVAGVPWGAVLPAEAARSRAALAAAARRAFERDGFACRAEELEVTVVTQRRDTLHFPAAAPAADEAPAAEGGGGEWSDSALAGAARIYLATPSAAAAAAAALLAAEGKRPPGSSGDPAPAPA